MNSSDIYNKICGFSPTPEQAEVFEILSNWNNSHNPMLLRLPCGYGKTESVVVPFLNQAISKNWTLAPRMIYVLPTRALCNQMHERISKYADKVSLLDEKSYLFCWDEIPGSDNDKLKQFLMRSFNLRWIQSANIEKKDDGKTISISDEKHSISLKRNDEKMKVDLIFSDDKVNELIMKKENDKINIHRKMITVSIEHGTSSLDPLFFSDICITTFDQFLYGYARNKSQVGRHVDVPAGAFANSIVVFDEAHLYSPYTHALMKAILDILQSSKIPIIVMTATMPESLQNDLLDGLNHKVIEFQGKFLTDRKILWKLEEWTLLKDDIPSNELLQILDASQDKKILIVCNKVDVAQKLLLGLKDRGPKVIHSRFSVMDRSVKESNVIDLLGKNSTTKNGIIISTQVCEVGLDISCDLLITECASADALVQRIGRVARWGGSGNVVIVKPVPVIKDDKELFYPYINKLLGDKGNFVIISMRYLKENHALDFTSWKETEAFCNLMEYQVDYVDARNAMGKVFDATLYADSIPYNLSARDELYCTVFIGALNKPEKKKSVDAGKTISFNSRTFKFSEIIPYGEIKQLCLNVSYLWFIKFWSKKDGDKKGLLLVEYDPKNQVLIEKTLGNPPRPFKIYALLDEEGIQEEDKNYNSEIGLKPKSQEIEEEACLLC